MPHSRRSGDDTTPPPGRGDPAGDGVSATAVHDELVALRGELLAAIRRPVMSLDAIDQSHGVSAVNMLQYLALRRHDLRELQPELTRLGLSSLGRCEAHVFASVDAATRAAAHLLGLEPPDDSVWASVPTVDTGPEALAVHTAALLGPAPVDRSTRIMVTIPSEAVEDPELVGRFVAEGMDCAQINCAHDDPDTWRAMARRVRDAAAEAGRPVRIMMDLAGPKIRTGALESGRGVIKIRPRRDPYGTVIDPATVVLTVVPVDDALAIPVDPIDISAVGPGTELELVDARGSKRTLYVTGSHDHGWTAEVHRTTYLVAGLELFVDDQVVAVVGNLPSRPGSIRLTRGDLLVLTDDASAAPPSDPPRIGCTLPDVLAGLTVGQPVWFDDGKFGTIVEHVGAHEANLRVVHAPSGGATLRAEKGINLPGTELRVAALSDDDRADLAVVAEIADCVALSFVQRPADIADLLDELRRLGADHLGVIAKIESQIGYQRLPAIIVSLMAHHTVGVMIARGDLAVELGYEHLAEVQEEITWLCESAHLPVIWATQVLENLAKNGTPSRAEITDAAMGNRAECVMLNKGPFIHDAIALLDGIFQRMQTHHTKKRALLGQLHTWVSTPGSDQHRSSGSRRDDRAAELAADAVSTELRFDDPPLT